jgi:phosphatidylglycerophosphatase A
MSQPSPSTPTPTTSSATRKPRVSLAIATAFGLGYLPKAPGTWGSLGGVVLAALPFWSLTFFGHFPSLISPREIYLDYFDTGFPISSIAIVALIGLFSAHRASRFWGIKDPQKVVIDEVSGQQITIVLGAGLQGTFAAANWKYLLLGFILFRVFDIWKPFPARQAESLPGGLGIMADDWIAGIYAALGLWLARAIGL